MPVALHELCDKACTLSQVAAVRAVVLEFFQSGLFSSDLMGVVAGHALLCSVATSS